MSKHHALRWIRLNMTTWPTHIIRRNNHSYPSPEGWKWKYVHKPKPAKSEMVLYSLCSDETIVYDEVTL